MARKRESLADMLLALPWWVSASVAMVAYLALTFAAPAYFASNPLTVGVGRTAVQLAPWAGGFFLLLALASLIRAKLISRRFDRTDGIDDIRSMTWRQFESIVGEAFRRRGYFVMENAVDGADGGVDLILRKESQKFLVQCKQWKKHTVGVRPVRELFGLVSAREAEGGFFVTSGNYTQDAIAFAKTSGIELIDGSALLRMVEEARQGEPFLDPTNTHSRATTTFSIGADTPSCPQCGGLMVARTAKRGANAGSQFWGCSRYPQCRGTREIA